MTPFDQLAAAFAALQIPLHPAEWHGLMAGAGAGGGRTPEQVLTLLEAELAAEVIEDGVRRAFAAIAADTAAELTRIDYGFQLLLPTDEKPLPARVEALAAWCQGFLAGLGQSGVARSLGADTSAALNDLAAIGCADTLLDGSEEDERDYAELVEYVRAAALLIDAELRERRAAAKLH
ncbi:MAG TPA: UPF0149 family protein [Porticoccaceae bacterium]|nr:UPF0149 family protein [Porticoccaceae bacterium]